MNVNERFAEFDPERTGTLLLSEFIQVLMQLGFDLSEAPGAVDDAARDAHGKDWVRKTQEAQMTRVRGAIGDRMMRPRGGRRAEGTTTRSCRSRTTRRSGSSSGTARATRRRWCATCSCAR